jgi:glucose-1-phosphate thymidylyltransferase
MKCLLLGAGYATRLYPLTRNRPKPLLPVGGVAMLTRICEQVFKVKEVDRIYLVSNHRFVGHYYNWLREYERSRSLPVPIEIFDDLTTSNDDRLGAIGDMQFVIQHAKVDDDMLIIAGDNLIKFALEDFTSFATPKGSAICLKDLGSKEKVSLYASVELDDKGRVVDFEEKPPQPSTSLVSIGVYCYSKKHIPLIDKYLKEGRSKDRPGNLVQWLYQQVDLHGYVTEGDWFDIGDIDSYNEANEMFKDQ